MSTVHPCDDLMSLGYGQLIQVRMAGEPDRIGVVVDVARAPGGMIVARLFDSVERRFGPSRNVRAEDIRPGSPDLSPVQVEALIEAAPPTVRQMMLVRRAA